MNEQKKDLLKRIPLMRNWAQKHHIMNLQEELNKLKPFILKDDAAFEKQIDFLYENFNSEKEKEIITNFIMSELNKSGKKIDDFIEETKIKMQLFEVSEIVSLSYIARKYFQRTRNWLYQKINGSIEIGRAHV